MSNAKKMPLKGAEQGKVRTRFPPEASGYLHIGHAKAALTNFILAQDFGGTMVMRFDDTNPEKENTDYEKAILEDLASLGITWDGEISYTSNHFEKLLELATKMIEEGKAYCDDTPVEEMREKRGTGEPTKHRDNSVEQNKEMWAHMIAGDEQGMQTCLRAKLSVDNKNKCLRDPVLYRCKAQPHPHHGDKYKVYPTYDFACPIVDAVEGVTHALRTSEYNDRNPQYEWIAKAVGLKPPKIQDFSRLNMEYTVMSKRKLTEFVQRGVVSGWDDPRMPTVRGLLRRGVLVEALKDFVREQGLSRVVNTMEWEKIYNINKKFLDAKAPRYTVVDEHRIPVALKGIEGLEESEQALHPKDASVGKKLLYKSNTIYLEEKDVELLKEGEEVTLLIWGNAIIEKINKDENGKILNVEARLHLEGDFKKTEQKLSWLAEHPSNIAVVLHEFDNIINIRSVDKETVLTDAHMNEQTEYIMNGIAEPAIANLKKGDIVQFQRRGFYILDSRPEEGTAGFWHFFFIPDGKLKLNHLSAMKRAGKKEVTLEDRKVAANERGAKQAAGNAKKQEKKEKKPRGKEGAAGAEGAPAEAAPATEEKAPEAQQ